MERKKHFKFYVRISATAYIAAFAVCVIASFVPLWRDGLAAAFLVFVLFGALASGIAGEYSDYYEELSREDLEELQRLVWEYKSLNQKEVDKSGQDMI